jgi:hypothetical protein
MTRPERSGKASNEHKFFLHLPKAPRRASKQLNHLIVFEDERTLRSRTDVRFAPPGGDVEIPSRGCRPPREAARDAYCDRN